jgi:uncharacterized membrane protein (UPF0127 family)
MKRPRLLLATLAASLACASLSACSTGSSAASKSQESAQALGTVDAQPAAVQPAAAKKKLGTPQPRLPLGKLELDSPPRAPLVLTVEVASTDAQRQTGMMFRDAMRDDEGMLFVFSTERQNSFWMHNTLIPLDMVFIDSEWKVVGVVAEATPQTDDPRSVPNMSQYVLEVNGGLAARNGVTAGTTVRFTPPTETP